MFILCSEIPFEIQSMYVYNCYLVTSNGRWERNLNLSMAEPKLLKADSPIVFFRLMEVTAVHSAV